MGTTIEGSYSKVVSTTVLMVKAVRVQMSTLNSSPVGLHRLKLQEAIFGGNGKTKTFKNIHTLGTELMTESPRIYEVNTGRG